MLLGGSDLQLLFSLGRWSYEQISPSSEGTQPQYFPFWATILPYKKCTVSSCIIKPRDKMQQHNEVRTVSTNHEDLRWGNHRTKRAFLYLFGGCSWSRIVEFFPLTVLSSGQSIDSSTLTALTLGYAVLSTLFTWPSHAEISCLLHFLRSLGTWVKITASLRAKHMPSEGAVVSSIWVSSSRCGPCVSKCWFVLVIWID